MSLQAVNWGQIHKDILFAKCFYQCIQFGQVFALTEKWKGPILEETKTETEGDSWSDTN